MDFIGLEINSNINWFQLILHLCTAVVREVIKYRWEYKSLKSKNSEKVIRKYIFSGEDLPTIFKRAMAGFTPFAIFVLFITRANAKICPDVIESSWCSDNYTCTAINLKYTISGANYINPILAFDTVKVHLTGPSNFFYGYREEDSFWAWNFWLSDKLFGGESTTVYNITGICRSFCFPLCKLDFM